MQILIKKVYIRFSVKEMYNSKQHGVIMHSLLILELCLESRISFTP